MGRGPAGHHLANRNQWRDWMHIKLNNQPLRIFPHGIMTYEALVAAAGGHWGAAVKVWNARGGIHGPLYPGQRVICTRRTRVTVLPSREPPR